MTHPFDLPAGSAFVQGIVSEIKKAHIYYRPQFSIIFVCGGDVADNSYSRAKFLKYARELLPDKILLLAEDALNDISQHHPPQRVNLSAFESVIAHISDCVVIFPESPGSYAELGFFSAHEEISKKCLVVNDIYHQRKSFLNDGPILYIDELSYLAPKITLSLSDDVVDFTLVVERLGQWSSQKYRKRVHLENFNELELKSLAALLICILSIFPSIDFDGIKKLVYMLFRKYDVAALRNILSVLIAGSIVGRDDAGEGNFYLRNRDRIPVEMEQVSLDELRLIAIDYFKRRAPAYLRDRRSC